MRWERLVVGPIESNCYLLFHRPEGEAAVIDPGGDAGRILDAIARRALRITYILLTHTHFDHIGALAQVQAATGAPVLVHAAEAGWIGDPTLNLSANLTGLLPEPVQGPPPDRLLHGGEQVKVAGQSVRVLATPGHTPGGLSFWLPRQAWVFTGDALFRGSIGRTDLPGGDPVLLIDGITRSLLSLPDETVILPGHGPESTIGEERRANPFLQDAHRFSP
ncbi:MBL fold metallo-hydrolase [Limnochorda pilosa]|uniref:Beta-lactamase n=1 Tax=Limnochorda pilosa TaxID=1555112 RepID=A0A0K2SPG2_LIMPI|nr:MBL fold metallo-hydrolase [Limnochorda pilosa]BAS29028.1 beta-lactamase [Limnochorda pilosa]